MCKLCDKIYGVSESSPEFTDYLGYCPEGELEIYVGYYDSHYDLYCHTTRGVNFCPECGKRLK